jgi:hypothetical protein
MKTAAAAGTEEKSSASRSGTNSSRSLNTNSFYSGQYGGAFTLSETCTAEFLPEIFAFHLDDAAHFMQT